MLVCFRAPDFWKLSYIQSLRVQVPKHDGIRSQKPLEVQDLAYSAE